MKDIDKNKYLIIASKMNLNKIENVLNKNGYNRLSISRSRIKELSISEYFKDVSLHSLKNLASVFVPSTTEILSIVKMCLLNLDFCKAINLKEVSLKTFISKMSHEFCLDLSNCNKLESLKISDLNIYSIILPENRMSLISLSDISTKFFYSLPFLNTESLELDLNGLKISDGKLFIESNDLKNLSIYNAENLQEIIIEPKTELDYLQINERYDSRNKSSIHTLPEISKRCNCVRLGKFMVSFGIIKSYLEKIVSARTFDGYFKYDFPISEKEFNEIKPMIDILIARKWTINFETL